LVGILEVSRRLAREGLLLKLRLEAGDVESELGAGSAGGREVIIINLIWLAAPSGLSPKQAALQRNGKLCSQDCKRGRLPEFFQDHAAVYSGTCGEVPWDSLADAVIGIGRGYQLAPAFM
jgi:hypothetical protein